MPHGLDTICRRCHRASVSEWMKANRDKRRTNDARRRAHKRAASDPHANHAAIKAIYECAYFASLFIDEPFAVDHRVPLCRGGKHAPRNLRHIPARLNSIKGGRLDHEVDDPEFKAWLAQARLGPAFEQIACLVRLGGRTRLYHLD